MNPHKGATGLRRLLNAARNSFNGIRDALAQEAAFRQEAILALALVPIGLWLGGTGVEKALLAASALMVPVVELLNSAIEASVDRVSLDEHPLAKRAKDFGSAAVMLALALCGAVWFLVLAF